MADHRENKRRENFRRQQAAFVKAWHSLPPEVPPSVRAERAAIAAGYSPATARSAGYKLLSKPHIREQILSEHPRALAAKAGIDAAWHLNELAELWETELTALFDEEGRLLPIDEMPPNAQKLIAGFEIVEEVEYREGKRTVTVRTGKIKLIDRVALLDKIGKNHLVSAYVTPEQRAVEQSLGRLLRAIEKPIEQVRTIDVAAEKPQPRSLADVIGSSDE